MLRRSPGLLAKAKRRTGKKQSKKGIEPSRIITDASGDIVDLTGYVTKGQQSKHSTGFNSLNTGRTQTHSKYVNKRRTARMTEYLNQQPRVEGGSMQPWIGYGMMDHAPHPMHDLTHEELKEYVQGTEYSELPEVEGKNQHGYPRLPVETDEITRNTTGFETGSPHHIEDFDTPLDVFGGTTHKAGWLSDPRYMSSDPRYDADLSNISQHSAEQQFADNELQPVYIENSPQFEATVQMRYENGRWVKTHDPDFTPMPHRSLAAVIDTKLMEDHTDLGNQADGGYTEEMIKFAGLTQSNAGADVEDTMDVEGDVAPELSSPPAQRQRLPDSVTTQQQLITTATEDPTTWDSENFLDLMAVEGETSPSPNMDRTINGIPVDATDTRFLLDPNTLHDEHENHVFSGLYPRAPGQDMTEFEKTRLARCLEMHQKQGVPLASRGVDPYSSIAFYRRDSAYKTDLDDKTGRKHDLSVEFRLRQKLKLGHDVAEDMRPAYRLNEDVGGKVWKYMGNVTEPRSSGMQISINSSNLHVLNFTPNGVIKDGKWKMYGDTPHTTQGNEMKQNLAANSVHHSGTQAYQNNVTDYLTPQQGYALKQAEDLERETNRRILVDQRRAEKEKAYRVRMGLDEAEQPPAPEHSAAKISSMQMTPPDQETIDFELYKLDDFSHMSQQVPANKALHPDPMSTWGRDPWRRDLRYTGWNVVGTHFKDIPEEYMQMRGSGHYDGAYGVVKGEPEGRKIIIDKLDMLGWRVSKAYGQRKWNHYKGVVSKGNHLLEAGFKQDDLPPSGPGKEITNDLLKEGTKSPTKDLYWAYKSKLAEPSENGEVREKFNWA
eukprot:TRINITY_DN5289_c0_g1_i1.p1 TRINITY_DN5289_c0_g1~~TRINITY_DN5289_c0_g1_i1.p1  ORF type:complete len:830 (+),score=97.35 TRINITY_DN5289_c0_g1_i1:40-2529(+)